MKLKYQNTLYNTMAQQRDALSECNSSFAYRLGYTLLYEKKSLLNPKAIYRKLKTLKSILQAKRREVDRSQGFNIPNTSKHKFINEIKVALICDEFSYNSFKDEFNTLVIEPHNWLETFKKHKPDLFFCESTWEGIDSKKKPWRGKIYAQENPKKENRIVLLSILKYCKLNNIPTIFWNKEDPTHYNDKKHNFVDTAIRFDYLFTTAYECIEQYKQNYFHPHVYCLPFATQPKLFNPIEKFQRNHCITFAGSWYEEHQERSQDMKNIFDTILNSSQCLTIYNRHYYNKDEKRKFPKKYTAYIKPNLPHSQIDKVYKSSIYGLNINTVKYSTTMFARRVFELMSSNTLVITNSSIGIEKLFSSLYIDIEKDPKALKSLNLHDINIMRDKALHNVLEKHTYNNRFQTILNTISFSYKEPDKSITLIMIAKSEKDIKSIEDIFNNQQEINKKLYILYKDSFTQKIKNKNLISIKEFTKNYKKILNTPYTCLLELDTNLATDRVKNALLHTSYIEVPIAFNASLKYTFSNKLESQNILCKSSAFDLLFFNDYQKACGKFYNV